MFPSKIFKRFQALIERYSFYLKGNDTNKYSVQFDQFYECVPSNDSCTKNGNSEIALASLQWNFTLPEEVDGIIQFTITAIGGNKMRFSTLQFVNHMFKDGKVSHLFQLTIMQEI